MPQNDKEGGNDLETRRRGCCGLGLRRLRHERRDRTTGGAAAGAATGAGIGALGGPVGALAGAAIGAGAGAVTGATTSPSDVNLGRPPWSNPEVRTPLDDDRAARGEAHRRDRQTAQAGARRATSATGPIWAAAW